MDVELRRWARLRESVRLLRVINSFSQASCSSIYDIMLSFIPAIKDTSVSLILKRSSV